MNTRLLAIGDIHGCYDPLCELVEKKISIRHDDRIVMLGDYIDRGFQSKAVIDYIIDLRGKGFDIITLTGNHESMLLDSLISEKSMNNWFLNGGYETLASFGVESPSDLDHKYLHFFKNLLPYYIQENFIFVHAGFNDAVIDPFQDKIQMIWSRRETYSNPVFDGRIIIHGHTPIPLPVCLEEVSSGNRVINIDTGCVYGESGGYGHLTAIELYTRDLFFV